MCKKYFFPKLFDGYSGIISQYLKFDLKQLSQNNLYSETTFILITDKNLMHDP